VLVLNVLIKQYVQQITILESELTKPNVEIYYRWTLRREFRDHILTVYN